MTLSKNLGFPLPERGGNSWSGSAVSGQTKAALALEMIDSAIGALQQSGPGGGSDQRFVFTQNVPASSWYVLHNLGKYPAVTVIDSSGHEVIGDVSHNSANALTLTFSAPFAGSVHLN